ncbi:MAG TPA: NAD(P)-dependent alcohol dehydrogenase [Thermoanaerobaculia bacterium]|nr:NAD(P)-dependent alcohol dehydrogenase [Thermoanaerobaculia bacterium]
MELRGIGKEGIVETERPRPEPGPGQLLVRVRAASINYRDLALIRGDYGAVSYPLVPLSDGAGEVVEVGAGVTRFAPGDRVIFAMRPLWNDGIPTRKAITTSLGMTLDGVLAEYRVADEAHVVRTPSHLSDEQAASLPIAAVTAWTALVNGGNLRAGQSVVVQGTGGVSLFALQFAKFLGARTFITSSSGEKLARARALGADHTINYREMPEWHEEVVARTDGEGADHVLDVGGTATFDRSLEAVRPGGSIYLVGFLGGTRLELDLPKIFRRAAVLRGLSVGPISAFEQMNAAIEQWRLEPVIDRVFDRHELRAALDYMEEGKQFGKIALRV